MSQPDDPMPKSPASHLHVMNLVVALLAGVISITGGIYSLKNNIFAGPSIGSLQGTVRDERIARPLKFASVEIADLTGAVVNTAATDDNGHYLIDSLKTGNYIVKFSAPLHKIESKTIRVEKNLTSSINVDLVPEATQTPLASVEPAASVRQNINAPYTPATSYPAAVPALANYNPSQNTATSQTSSPTYGQTGAVSDPSLSNPGSSGYRRHSRRSYSGGSVDNSSGTSQSSSQGSALAETGAQLLQALLSKKSGSSSSATTTN